MTRQTLRPNGGSSMPWWRKNLTGLWNWFPRVLRINPRRSRAHPEPRAHPETEGGALTRPERAFSAELVSLAATDVRPRNGKPRAV
jgi:hypothetical protein